MLTLGEARKKKYGNSVYYFYNSYVNLKLCQYKGYFFFQFLNHILPYLYRAATLAHRPYHRDFPDSHVFRICPL